MAIVTLNLKAKMTKTVIDGLLVGGLASYAFGGLGSPWFWVTIVGWAFISTAAGDYDQRKLSG